MEVDEIDLCLSQNIITKLNGGRRERFMAFPKTLAQSEIKLELMD